MKQVINQKLFSIALFILTSIVIAKVIWLVIALLFLPKSGVEFSNASESKALYYPIKLASSSPTVAPVKAPVSKTSNTAGNMQGYKLLALYNASDALVVTVEYTGKSKVLSKGEEINGFVLKSATADSAIFTKGEKEFELKLRRTQGKPINQAIRSTTSDIIPKPDDTPTEGIKDNIDGTGKVVPKELLTSYTKDMDKIWKDIGIGEYKPNGQLSGFKVNFIKKGSDFEKLGLQRGDILTGINGQDLNSYNAAFSFYKEMDNVENLTLSIKRNNQEMELEYEIE